MSKEEAFYIICNIPIPVYDKNYDICQYQEAKSIALDCIQKVIYSEKSNEYNQAIDDFKNLCLQHKSKDDYPVMCFDEFTINKFSEQLKKKRI